MKRLAATLTIIATLTIAAPAAAYDGPAENTEVTCDTFTTAIFGLQGERVVVRADGQLVYRGRITPYLTWSDEWPRERRNHRLVVRVGRDRFVFRVRGCR